MKKKICLIFLIITLIACLTLALTGCDLIDKIKSIGNNDSSSSSEEEEDKPCTHQYSTETYSYDSDYHFYQCTICGEIIESTKQEHTITKEVITEATCTTKGIRKVTCTVCGYNYQEVIPSAEAHVWDTGTITEESTCSKQGTKTYTCTLCHTTKTEKLPLAEHTYDAEDWSKDSSTHYHVCSVCGGKVSEDEHDYEESVVTAATCTENGVKKLTCKVCGYSYNDTIEKLGHDLDETIITEATCTTEGLKHVACTRCSYEADEVIPTNGGHDYGSGVVTTEPTCTTKGVRTYTCSRCSDVKTEEIDALDHNYEGYVCTRCHKDKFLEYQSDFKTKGNSSTDLIEIDTEEEMIAFLDFMFLSESTTSKYVDVTYTTVTKDNLSTFTSNASAKTTTGSWHLGMTYPSVSGKLPYICYKLKEDYSTLSEKATRSVNHDPAYYVDTRYTQQETIQITDYANTRATDYSTFKYLDREYSMNVSSSDQLFYAFEHGYKPICEAGSSAETILNLAKEVCIKIIDDSMTDSEKIIAIYNWFINEVQYDYGAFENITSTDNCKYYAWYPEGVFIDKTSVCDGMAKSFCILAGIEDILCVRITSSNHAWNRVYIDADGDGTVEWTNIDATWGNSGLNNTYEVLSLDDLYCTDSFKATNGQTGTNYIDASATESINMYRLLHFGSDLESVSNDYVIESYEELKALMYVLKSELSTLTTDNLTVEFLMTYSNDTGEFSRAASSVGMVCSLALSGGDAITLDGTSGYVYTLLIGASSM